MTDELEQKALITIFGGTGDLANRKLYPSLYHLYSKGSLGDNFAVIGTARREWSNDFFRDKVKESIKDIDGSEKRRRCICFSLLLSIS